MAASLGIEEESGRFTGRTHPHNGYYAGDFSAQPIPATPPEAGSWVTTLVSGW